MQSFYNRQYANNNKEERDIFKENISYRILFILKNDWNIQNDFFSLNILRKLISNVDISALNFYIGIKKGKIYLIDWKFLPTLKCKYF